jgi:hypothetical protein
VSHHACTFDDRAFDMAVAYHLHIAAGITASHGHLTAAVLAGGVADAEYIRAALADTAGERRTFGHAGDKARAARNFHQLAAEITAVGEQLVGRWTRLDRRHDEQARQQRTHALHLVGQLCSAIAAGLVDSGVPATGAAGGRLS